jgi:hypothetical protein
MRITSERPSSSRTKEAVWLSIGKETKHGEPRRLGSTTCDQKRPSPACQRQRLGRDDFVAQAVKSSGIAVVESR